MKVLVLIILLWTSVLAEHYVVLGGAVWHKEKTNRVGDQYETVIETVGYQYRDTSENLSWGVSAIGMSDSNNNPQYSTTISGAYKVLPKIYLGLEVGMASRVVQVIDLDKQLVTSEYRTLIPVALPKLEIDLDRVIINMIYIPEVDLGDIRVTEAAYINFSLRI